MTIRDRWISLFHRVASGTRKRRTLLTPVGILIFATFVSLFVIVAVSVDAWLALPWPLPDGISTVIGMLLISLGVASTAWSVLHFLKVKGTPVPFNPPPTVVTAGPYRYSRNPMLTGVFLLLFGIGFAIQSLSLLVCFAPLFVLVNVWELKAIEEPELMKRLGQGYTEYRDRTPMFIPGKRGKKMPRFLPGARTDD